MSKTTRRIPVAVMDGAGEHLLRRASDWPLARLTLNTIEQLEARYQDRLAAAVVAELKQQLRQVERAYDKLQQDVQSGTVTLRTVGAVRDTTAHMFRSLAEQPAGDKPFARVYRSVCVCNDARYFERPFIRTLSLAFASATVESLNQPTAATGLRVERIIIVPAGMWLAPGRLPSKMQSAYWKSLLRMLFPLHGAAAQGPDGGRARVISRTVACEAVRSAALDFGIYGDLAVGVYRRDRQRERLRLFLGESDELRRCDASWRILNVPSIPCRDLAEIVEQVDFQAEREAHG